MVNCKKKSLLLTMTAFSMILPSIQVSHASESSSILINEVESSDASGGNDWVEIINISDTDIDISGWYITDDKGKERVDESSTYPLIENTTLKAGEVLVLEETVNFDFGLGTGDTVTLYNANGEQVDTYSWSGHAAGTYSRTSTGEFVDQAPTKGAVNTISDSEEEDNTTKSQLVINEVNSSPDDWVEIMNIGNTAIDLSEYEIRDNSDDHRWRFNSGTQIKAGSLLLVKADTTGLVFDDSTDTYVEGVFDEAIGIGSGDSIRLYDNQGILLDSHSWSEHANVNGDESASWGRYPDGTGSFVLMPETPGVQNRWYAPSIVINEVESNGGDTDWVEVYNAGTADVDISGWYLYDNDPTGHINDIIPVAEGTVLKPGEFYVFDSNTHFTFGLGKADSVTIYNKDGAVVDSYSWNTHANGVYARIPDGTGEFVDFETSTKGKANVVVNPVILNEIQSNDPNGGCDWIELANPTSEPLDISGLVIKDDDDLHEYIIPEGTVISANSFLVITDDELGFGLGKNDSVRIFENGLLIQSTTWSGHTSPTWGFDGIAYQNTKEETPGKANEFEGTPDVEAWDGEDEVIESNLNFLEDSSGLDFHNGQLYAVDNGTGKFWILDVAEDGTLSFANGFENGKTVNFINGSNKGPDTEGISVDGDGYIYLASERDNSNKGVNYNVILKADPNQEGTNLTAMQEWNLTTYLPDVSANMGIEAVEWVSFDDMNGQLIDQNTNTPFDSSNYSNAVADGIFFVALEDNGHVYGFVLNTDGTAVLISDIDSKLGGAMALDYDTYEDVLWVVADDGYGNLAAKVTFNGTESPDILHVLPPVDLDITRNNEGFAIASADYTVDGQRPVYRFCDGVTSGALTIGKLACDYKDISNNETTNPSVTPDDDNKLPSIDQEKDNEQIQNKDKNVNELIQTEKVVQTGDITPITMFGLMMAFSLVGMILGLKKKKQHN
ncbi:MAG: lamin tail domain-containing protein [Bacilli bacterium]|nr:lamin tail domain-containing protein [Bacilli bacterium]